jgi:hypothetical protein
MFEHQTAPLLPRRAFLRRLLRHFGLSVAILFGSLLLGVFGYHILERQAWIDAILNAAMILGGMGPVGELRTSAGKLFAAAYALYSGIVFLVVVGVLFAPAIHRALHRFHLEGSRQR